MIKQLRIKFITVTMILVAVMLLSIFVLVYHTTLRDLTNDNLHILKGLERHLQHEAPSDKSPDLPDPPDRMPNMCFVLTKLPDGSIQITSGYADIPDENTLQELLCLAEASEEQTGIFYRYSLRYYRLQDTDGSSYAFMDVTHEMQTLWDLVLNCMIIGLATLALFMPISWFLARVITHPVEQAIAQQRQFVADASHELKTPLTVILTNSELLQSPAYSPQDRQRFIDTIHTTAVRMRQLVGSLLDLARLDQSKQKQLYGIVDLSALTEECGMLFEPVYFEAGRELLCDIEADICLRGDEIKLQQLVDILLDNGCKYSDEESQVCLQLQRQGTHSCLLQISSRGKELTPQQCRDIFKRFYRVDEARTGTGSYGLGLPIAQQIVLDHRGKIWCVGKDGMNTFYVQFPTGNK